MQAPAEICAIPEGRESALALTYDDGSRTHYTHALPTHVKYKVPATFLIVTDRVEADAPGRARMRVSWDELRAMHDQGMEIANHTRDHPNMREIENQGASEEMQQGKSPAGLSALREKNYPALLAEVTDATQALVAHGLPRPITFGFPYSACPDCAERLLADAGPLWPRRENLMTGNGDTPGTYDKALAELLRPGQIGVVVVHGIGTQTPDDGWNPITSLATYEYLVAKAGELSVSGKVYVGKHGEIMRYRYRAAGSRLQENADGTFTIAPTVAPAGGAPAAGGWELWLRAAPGAQVKVNGRDAAPDARGVFTARVGDVLRAGE
ncbi:MAG: polysaccharide deacetylase family protein [Planctomycetes bacterium]|nr:polysaccharide deacetylase family protein [Planctomycetota bacterium]